MSLDVSLVVPGAKVPRGSGIFIRVEGKGAVEITREEWDRLNPGREPCVVQYEDSATDEVYSDGITHNLNEMALEAGIYEALWHPDKILCVWAHDISPVLRRGIATLKADPDRFKAMNPSNGWGTYDTLLQFAEDYLAACEKWPDAEINVSR